MGPGTYSELTLQKAGRMNARQTNKHIQHFLRLSTALENYDGK